MDTPLIISIAAFLGALIAALGVFSYLEYKKSGRQWKERVEGKPADLSDMQEGYGAFKGYLVTLLTQLGGATKPKDEAEVSKLRRSLITAGVRSPRAPILFYGAKLLCAIVLPLAFLTLRPPAIKLLPATTTMIIYVILAFAGFYLPQIWLRMKTTRRKQNILDGFPDALDLIVLSVEAGLGLAPAISRVGEELRLAHRDLSDEFSLLSLELRTGLTRQQALRNLASRTELDDVKSLVAMLIQTDRFGTSLGASLRIYADCMRKNRRLRAEELAAKLPVKMIFPMMFFIFPSFFIVVVGPAVIRVIRVLLPALAK